MLFKACSYLCSSTLHLETAKNQRQHDVWGEDVGDFSIKTTPLGFAPLVMPASPWKLCSMGDATTLPGSPSLLREQKTRDERDFPVWG